jgi:predicted translin family RNA/ssDNA-binding protein
MRNQLERLSKVRNATNKLARRIKILWTRLVKENIQISNDQLRDRKQIIPELVHKSDIIQGEVVIYLDDTGTEHLTFLVIPKSHILLVWQGSEAG